jgi:hypothetical protein
MDADPNLANAVQAAMPDAAIAIVGELIPIVAIVMGVGIGMLTLYLDFRKKREMYQLYHAERMAAIERGIELPPLPREFFGNYRDPETMVARNRRRGLILLFAGIAITVALVGTGIRQAWWGSLPIALGAAYLVASRFESAELKKSQSNGQPPVVR